MAQLRALIFKNAALKLLSLGLAALLWFFVSGKSKTELALSVPIEFTSIPKDMTIINKVPTSIHIRVKGTKTLLRPLTVKPPSLSVNLSKATTGKNVIHLAQESFNDLPLGVDVVNLDPESLTIYLDRFIITRLPIRVRTLGSPPRGYQVREIRVTPPEVEFKVSERYLKGHDYVTTEPIDISQIRKDATFEVSLLTPPNELKPINPETRINATFIISESLAQRVIKGIRINFINRIPKLGRIGISNYFVDLVVECPLLTQVDDIRKNAHITVDLKPLLSDRQGGYYTLPIKVELPEHVRLLSMDPAEVEIVLRKNAP
jgi:YbbR domain-containing protein